MTWCHFCGGDENMPTNTFMKLPEDKKNKIIKAAKKEFSRVSFEETSINKIIEEAEISRGSFYQYFFSKEDLLSYIMKKDIDIIDNTIDKILKDSNGDIFEVFIYMYDKMSKHTCKEEAEFHKRIFESIKTDQDIFFFLELEDDRNAKIKKLYSRINQENLRVQNEEELIIVFEMLMGVTTKAVINSFKQDSKQKAKQIYLKEIDYLKNGILK